VAANKIARQRKITTDFRFFQQATHFSHSHSTRAFLFDVLLMYSVP
jgi:hypothetical protein